MKETIKKSLVGGLVFSITTLTIFVVYAIGSYSLPNKVTSGSGLLSNEWNKMVDSIDNLNSRAVPSGAIMAFNLGSCPTNWSEYTPARGRFLRGIDSTGTNDSVRIAGNLQDDAFQGHQHDLGGQSAGVNNIVSFQDTNTDSTYGVTAGPTRGDVYIYVRNPRTDGVNGTPRTTNETRPKNVAVLYCVKD